MGYLRPRRRQLSSSAEHQGEPCADPPPAGRIRDGKGVGGPLGRFIALEAAHGIAIGLALDPSGPRRPRCSGVAGETHHGDAPEGVVGPACARSVDVAGHLPRRGLDRGGSAKGGEGGSAADALARVERACSALRQDSKPITFVSIALLAGVSRTSLYRDPSLRAGIDGLPTEGRSAARASIVIRPCERSLTNTVPHRLIPAPSAGSPEKSATYAPPLKFSPTGSVTTRSNFVNSKKSPARDSEPTEGWKVAGEASTPISRLKVE